MHTNERLTNNIRGRTIEAVTKEEGLVSFLFIDRSTLQIKTAGGLTENMLGEGRIERVEEAGATLTLFGEQDRVAILSLASAGSSVTVKTKDSQVEYSG